MYKRCLLVVLLSLFFLCPISAMAKSRILFVDSYHAGYEWSDGVTEGIQLALQGADVELKIFRMDTKRNDSEAFKRKAALDAKAFIESFNPDVVIASDDNASKYLIQPYYKDANLPFVFCGVNHNTKAYGYPYKNVTGMIEISPINKLIYSLKHFNRAQKIVLLNGDEISDRKDAESYAELMELPFDQIHVSNFNQWELEYARIQNNYDILIIGNNASIKGWDDAAAMKVVMSKTKIPTGCDLDWITPFSFLGYTKVAQEQGRWAAHTALKIINGTPINSIPITHNVEGNLTINLKVAKVAGIRVPPNFLKKANRVIQ